MKKDLPVTDDDKESSRIKNWIPSKVQNAVSWINTEDGQILWNTIKSLGSFVVGDSANIVIPYLLDLSVSNLRRRFLQDLEDLSDRLNENKDSINESFLKSDVGQEILKETIGELIHQKDKEKREFHKQFLINAYTKKDVEQEQISTFLNILISLEPLDLQILRTLYDPSNLINQIIERNKMNDIFSLILKNEFMQYFGIEQGLFDRSVIRLETDYLMSTKRMSEHWVTGSYPKEHFEEGIQKATESISNIITPLGKAFVKFVTFT